jgi:hypothetical protein
LARFGEELSDIPLHISLRLNLFRNKEEFNRQLLQQKSKFLTRIDYLSYYRSIGDWFNSDNNKIQRWTSGLEQIIRIKCGMSDAQKETLLPAFISSKTNVTDEKQELIVNTDELEKQYRELDFYERNSFVLNEKLTERPEVEFDKIGIKTLVKKSIQFDNYRLSIPASSKQNVQVIFRKDYGKWIKLFERSTEKEAIKTIYQIINYFIRQNNVTEGLYIVDHILLNDFLEGSEYGYRFVNEYGETIFQTLEEESWCDSEKARCSSVARFYKTAISLGAYFFDDVKCEIKDSKNKVLVSHVFDDCSEIGQSSEKLFEQTKSIIKLFNAASEEKGLLHFEEMEKIRLHGVVSENGKNFSQRRLIYQRKLKSGEIIDEDFFDFKVSVILPDWPARFQEESFRDYLISIIHERIPTHIQNEIIWVDTEQMTGFEMKYNEWIKHKSLKKNIGTTNKELSDAAFNLYQKIMELTK